MTARSPTDMPSPNLARYLNNHAQSNRQIPGRIVQRQKEGSSQQQCTINKQYAMSRSKKKKDKTTISKKNLVIMYPSNHILNDVNEIANQTDDSLNVTQLLFSPGANEGVLHSIFSPPTNDSGKMLKNISTDGVDFLSPDSYHARSKRIYSVKKEIRKKNNSVNDHHTKRKTSEHNISDRKTNNGRQYRRVTVRIEDEKENMVPIQSAPKNYGVRDCNDECAYNHQNHNVTPQFERLERDNAASIHIQRPVTHLHNLKTPAKSPNVAREKLNHFSQSHGQFSNPKTPVKSIDSYKDSFTEFYTPCPKTPGAKQIDEISNESLNTIKKSRKHSLSSFSNQNYHECKGERNSLEEDVVFVTPKQREERPCEGSTDDDEFFSPLAEYHPSDDRMSETEDFVEGSSVDLMNEAKNLLGVSQSRQHLSVIEDEHSGNTVYSTRNTSEEVRYIHCNNNSTQITPLDDETIEEGSTYRAITDAMNILGNVEPKTRAAVPVHVEASAPYASKERILIDHNNDRTRESADTEEVGFTNCNRNFAQTAPLDDVTVEEGSTYRAITDAMYMLDNVESDTRVVLPGRHVEASASDASQEYMDIEHDARAHKSASAFDADMNDTGAFIETVDLQDPSQPNSHSEQIEITLTPDTHQTQKIISSHLHSPSISTLPPDALTVDFVKKCDSVETLETILSLLNVNKKGKQLRQPHLVQLVRKRLAKLGRNKDMSCNMGRKNMDCRSNTHENHQRQPFQRDSRQNVISGKKIAWSEDVKDGSDSSWANISEYSPFSIESNLFDDITHTDSVLNTPHVVEMVGMPPPTSSPSIQLDSIAESSLDMNLSESFTLGEESTYWKMAVDDIVEEVDGADIPLNREPQLQVELTRELEEIRKAYEEAKEEVTRLTVVLEENAKQKRNENKLEREVEAARLANRALANTLAISEKDLADAIELRDTKIQECTELMSKLNDTSDENAFLSCRVKELEQELQSCNAYIDSLYAELHEKSSPSHELQDELQKRESEWLELENRYDRTIEQLQAELNTQSKKVSMEMYLAVMKDSRRYKLDAAENQIKIDELTTTVKNLRDQIMKLQLTSYKPGHDPKNRPRQVSPTFQQSDSVTLRDHVSKENVAPISKQQVAASTGKHIISTTKSTRTTATKSTLDERKGLKLRP